MQLSFCRALVPPGALWHLLLPRSCPRHNPHVWGGPWDCGAASNVLHPAPVMDYWLCLVKRRLQPMAWRDWGRFLL